MDEDISTERKTWQVYNFGKRKVFRLDLNESREVFCQRGRGRSFHVDGPKTEKAREPAVKSLVGGIWSGVFIYIYKNWLSQGVLRIHTSTELYVQVRDN